MPLLNENLNFGLLRNDILWMSFFLVKALGCCYRSFDVDKRAITKEDSG